MSKKAKRRKVAGKKLKFVIEAVVPRGRPLALRLHPIVFSSGDPSVECDDPPFPNLSTPALTATNGKYYVSCAGKIFRPGGRALVTIYAVVVDNETPAFLDPPYSGPGGGTAGHISFPKYFEFLSKNNPDNPEYLVAGHLIEVKDPVPFQVQWLYVFGKLDDGTWAYPYGTSMNLVRANMTSAGDTSYP